MERFMPEKRLLLLMPEYEMVGAETQFRYLINYAGKKLETECYY